MALADYAAYKNRVSWKADNLFSKASVTFNGTNQAWNSSWTAAPDAGANATATARQCTAATVGALLTSQRAQLPVGDTTPYWLCEMELQIAAATNRTNSGIFMLLDRLADILPSATANATVTPIANLALTGFNLTGMRYADGNGVMAALFIQTVIVGAPVITLTYTNQAGVAGRTSKPCAPGAAQALSILPIALQDGDTGIRSVESYNITTAGTSGSVALVLYQPIATFVQPTNSDLPGFREMWGGITRVYPEACYDIVSTNIATSTTSGVIVGRLGIVAG